MHPGRTAEGRRLTPRNTPTGPGSRGGHWHEPEFRRAWHNAYRKEHPEYAERDYQVKRERRRQARIAKELSELDGVVLFSDVLREACREELRTRGLSRRELCRRMGLAHDMLDRFVGTQEKNPNAYVVDAIVAYFGIWQLARRFGKMRSRERTS